MENINIKVYPLTDQGNSTKAFASLTIDDLIAIKGIRVVEGSNGLFVTMPQSKDREGNYHDIAYPVTAHLRKAINKMILDEFKVLTKAVERTPNPLKTADKKSPKKTANDYPEL